MNWLQKVSQVNNLQQMLMQVAQGVADINQVAEYVAKLSPVTQDICEMINNIGGVYPGADASMRRLSRVAGCQFDPNVGEKENIMPGINTMSPPPAEKLTEMPSIEVMG